MRTTHKLNLTSARALWAACALFVLAGLVFAFAPMRPVAAARQALAARVNASPTAERILSIAPASVRKAIKNRLAAPETKAASAAVASAMFDAGITLEATPPSGSFVGQQQPLNVIVYTITVSNDGSTDAEVGPNDIQVAMNAPNGTLFQNLQVIQQPQFGSAWACTLPPALTSFSCSPAGTGAAGTFANQETVKIRVEAAVQASTVTGTLLIATARYIQTVAPAQNTVSNETQHSVNPFADLSVTKYSQTAQPLNTDPQNSVIAGGTTVTLINPIGGGEGTGNVTYLLRLRNDGPANANNVQIEDSIPGTQADLTNNGPNSAPGDLLAGPDPTANPGQALIEDRPTVTSIGINVPATATRFSFNCNGFGIGSTFTCVPANNTIIDPTYFAGVLPRFFRAQFAYRLRVRPSATPGNLISNQARIFSVGTGGPVPSAGSSATPDPNSANNTSLTTQNVIVAKSDLGITKATGNPTPVAGGAAFAYTLVVTNAGPSDSRNIVVIDPLPAGIVLANSNISVVNNPSIPGFGLICTGPAVGQNGTVTCTGHLPGPDLQTGAISTSTITLVVQAVANLAGGVRTNTATVTSSTQEGEPNTLPNTASVGVTIQNNASISITKTAPATACAGDNLTYNIAVTNAGSSSAVNVVVTDVLPLPANPPPGFTPFVSVTGTGAFDGNCSYNAGTNTLTCTAAFLPTGTSNINLVVRTSPGTANGPLTNNATLAAAVGTITGTNPATATTTINHCSDLEITKDDSPDAVLAGQDINYTITVKNVGPSDLAAGQFVVNDAPFPPAGTTLKGVINAPGFSCNGGVTFPCTATAPLPAGASATIKFTVTVNANFNGGQPGACVTNTATVAVISTPANPVVDANNSNNSSTICTPVGPSADLAITKQSETLAGSVFGAAVTAGGTTGDVGGFVTGTGEILYTLSYRNNGLGDASNVHIRDVVPGGTLLIPNFAVPNITQTGTAVTCSVGIIAGIPSPTYQLDCTPTAGGTLAAGASGTIQFRVRVPENVLEGKVIKNQATINSEGTGPNPATPDPNGGNNTSQQTQNIVRTSADLGIAKTAPATVIAGNNITYTLRVTNNGPSNAANVVVTDTLPAGVTFVSASSAFVATADFPGPFGPTSFSCSAAGTGPVVVTCTAASLIAPPTNPPPIIPAQVGSNVVDITIVGKVASSVPAGACPGNGLTNNSTVASSTPDPFAGNNTSSACTSVGTDAAVAIVKADNPDPVVAGTNLTYNITVTNNGPSDAQGVSVVDTLPAPPNAPPGSPNPAVQFLSASGTGVFSAANSCSQAAGVVTCNAIPGGVLPAGASANITIVVKVLPNVPANPLPHTPNNAQGLLNSATINWTDTNGVAGPAIPQTATATTLTTVRHESDMSIKKDAPDFVIAGSRFDIRLTVANHGPSDVLGDVNSQGSIMVTDLLPIGTSVPAAFPPFVAPGGPGNFTCYLQTGQGNGTQTRVICLNSDGAAGNFFAGANIEIIIKVDTLSSLPDGTNLYNCAQVTLRDVRLPGDVPGPPEPTPEIDPLGGGQHSGGNTGVRPNPPLVFPTITVAASGNNESCDATVVRTSADLAVSKAAVPVIDPDGVGGPLPPVPLPIVGPNVPPGSVNAGGYLRYDVPFGNNGPSDAINVMLSNVVPGNTAFVGALATGGVFVPAAQPPAVPFTFTIQATDTVAPLGGPISLTCTVISPPGGQQIFCRPQGNGTVANPNPPPANIAYADGTLPAGYNGQLTFFVKVNESVAGGTIISDPAIIASGLCPDGVPPFPPIPCASTPDPNPANNVSQVTQNVVVASSNLAVTKIVQSAVTSASNPNQTGPIGPATAPNGPGTTGTAVLPGTLLTYRVVLTNNGPSDVSNIRLTDVLPSGLETPPGRVLGARFVSATPVLPSGATFSCGQTVPPNPSNNPQGNGGSVVCTAPLLSANAPNNVAAIDITVFIDPATKASLVDTATFDATINNFNRPISGTTVLTTPVAPTSDLALTKTISDADVNTPGVQAPPIIAGNTFQYTVVLNNNGPSAAQMVVLTDTFPPFQRVTGVTILQTPNGNGAPAFSCTAVPAIGSPGNTTSLTCTAAELPPNRNADNTVNPSGTVTFIITAVQDPLTSQPAGVVFMNCVSASSMSTDPSPIPAPPSGVCIVVPVGFIANPVGTKVAVPEPVIAGNLLTYTITATNLGPSAALNFRIIDPLPLGTVFISAVASPGATLTTPAVGANGTVTAVWDAAGGTPAGLTAPGVVRTLTIVVRVCPDFQQILGLTDAQMCVPNLTDTATITSDTPGVAGTAASVTTVQAQSNLSIAKTGPAQIIYSTTPNPSNITYTITFANAGPSNANNVTITDILPKGFVPVAGGLTSTVAGTTFTTTTVGGITTVVANLGVLGAANQCRLTRPTSGTITIVARVPIKHPSISVTNQATILSTNCLPETGTLAVLNNPNTGFPPNITPGTGMLANNRAFATTNVVPPQTTPGAAYPALSEVSDQKEGSILFYPIYTSDAVNANTQNTRVAITNTSNTERVVVHLFAVDGGSCAVLDAFICLTPNQTSVFLASDFDPGNTGYLMAVAVEDATGLPKVFNELIGDEYVKFSTGHAANLGAEAIAASMVFPTGVDPNVTTTTLRFDGLNYNRLPRVLASDNIPSTADGNSTLLILDRVGGDFTTTGATIGGLVGLLYDDSEQAFSFTATQNVCQFRVILSNTFPRTFTQFNRIIPAGRTGWLKIWTALDRGLFGAQINFNASATTNANAFNQGHNLHKLTLTDTVTVTVPVFIPSC